ncbi:hypothetical protein MTR_1g064225 [Medicago truncatula]|uniref:Uncharacterized protein n=1 Tax=Medicago truncatula TaxID=3880 RepID=A0A072VKQ8_MEDTR|nr:hypothetical protein MTR_1g064225 [Medicago truncatula]
MELICKKFFKVLDGTSQGRAPSRSVHGLGQPRKPGQTHPENPKKWVGLDNWVGVVSKMENP